MAASKRKTWVGRVHLGAGRYHWVGRFTTKRERDDAVAKARIEKPWEAAQAPEEPDCNWWADRLLERRETGAALTRSGRRYKDSSVDQARSDLRPFRAEFGHRTPGSITRTEAEDWAAKHRRSVPVVITLMNELYRAEVIDRNRFEGLSRRTEGRRNERPPSEEEMVLLLEACSALGDHAPMMRALYTFAAFTVMRPGELFALDWEQDIDLSAGANGRVRVQRRLYRGRSALPKSNKPRTVTLLPPARQALDSLLELPGYYQTGYVFRNKTGGQLTEPTLSMYWSKVRARARLEHDFYTASKHYGVWYMKVKLNLPDAAIAAQAGWSEKSVTEMVKTYGHAVDERRLDDIDAAYQMQSQTQAAAIPLPDRD